MKTLTPPWIPPDQRRPLLKRLAIVWVVALLIALLNWNTLGQGRLDIPLVYSYAISTLTWAFCELPRFVLRRWLGAQPPHYWPPALPASLMLLIGIPLGYALGTALGDGYAGQSTWDLLAQNRPRFVGLLAASGAVSAAFVAYFYQRGKAETLARQVQEAQLQLLQSQLQPHMLFNTLAHLRALIQTAPTQAVVMLDHLDDYLRSALQASRSPSQPLSTEMQRLRDYLSLMAIRMGQRLQFELDLPPALAGQAVPSFILQPLVENAIRHGVEPQVEPGQISVSAQQQGTLLVLRVQDSGQGMDLSTPKISQSNNNSASSYGLQHVRERLHTLYGERASLQLLPVLPQGLCVQLQWPLEPQA